jgi:predicted chitinase
LDPNDPVNSNKLASINKELSKLDKEDKNQINTTKYFNIFDGDAYRFRPRGFLYIVGRKQYYQIYEDLIKVVKLQ